MAVRTIEEPGGGPAQENARVLSFDELRAQLRALGEERYHHRHPFHLMMHEGRLSRGQLQAWALNRYYYQSMIPIKDSIILSRGLDPSFRRAWRKRVVDHDGDAANGSSDGAKKNDGGIQRWLKLAEAAGLSADQVRAGTGTLPATRFAVNEYLNIVRSRTLLEAVASSLTELFSRDLITLRMEKMRQHYPWLSGGLDYFEARLTQAPEDATFAIHYVFENAKTRHEQELAIQALRDKCDILWAQLDALYFAYVQPGWPPPGAFRIEIS
jgi:coenzyme PQQ biosynthesis protein C